MSHFQPRMILDEKSPKASQPLNTKMKLYPHQLTMLYRVEEIERSFGDEIGYGIEATMPGAGKTFTMLSMILNDKHKNLKQKLINFIVMPHNIVEQWCQSITRFSDELTYKKLSYQDMIDYETLFDIETVINKTTHEKMIKSRKYYDIYIVPSTLYHPMVATIESNVVKDKKGNVFKLYDNDLMFRRIIFDEIDTIANLLVHAIPTERTWFVSASFTPARMGIYQSYFGIDGESGGDFDPTFVSKCDNEYVFANMKIPEPQKYDIECYNPILDKIISKIGYYTKEDMKALNAYDYSKLKFQFVKRIPNNEDQLLDYSKQEFEETLKDARDKIVYYQTNIKKMKEIEDQRYDLHDDLLDLVDAFAPLTKAMGQVIYYMKNVGLVENMDTLNEVLKDDANKSAIDTVSQSLKQGTYINGLLKMMKSKHMSLDNTNAYFTERYVEYLMMVRGHYDGKPEEKMVEVVQKYNKILKNFIQFITQVESEYNTFVNLIAKFKLIDALFSKYNSIMAKDQISKDEKETLIAIMRNFIEYYKKLSMVMKNSYYTYESGKDMVLAVEDFVKMNQKNRRTLHLHEGFEDMGKSNKYDFVNCVNLFIESFANYKQQLEVGLPKVNAMLQYVENYDNLRLYVEEFMKYTQIEKYYSEYVRLAKELTDTYIEKKNRDPLTYESNINEIIHHTMMENAQYEVHMEINKLDLIHQILRLLNSNPPKKRTLVEDGDSLSPSSTPTPTPVEKKRGRKPKGSDASPQLQFEPKYIESPLKVKIMIFSDFSSIFKKITPLCDMLNIKYVQLDGGNMRSIENAVRQYKQEDAQILFCDSTLFGCGMNFENTTHVIFTHTPNPEMRSQIIGRAQRIGRESILQVYQLHYPNEEMYSVIKKDTDAHMFHFMTVMKDQEEKQGVQDQDQEENGEGEDDEFEGGESSL